MSWPPDHKAVLTWKYAEPAKGLSAHSANPSARAEMPLRAMR